MMNDRDHEKNGHGQSKTAKAAHAIWQFLSFFKFDIFTRLTQSFT